MTFYYKKEKLPDLKSVQSKKDATIIKCNEMKNKQGLCQ